MTSITRLVGALALAGALTTAAGSGVAVATEPGGGAAPTTTKVVKPFDPAHAKQKCAAAIDERIGRMNALSGKVASNATVTPSHAASLNTNIAATITTLQDLKTRIAQQTEAAPLKAECGKVVDIARSQALQVHLVLGFDAAAVALTRLEAAADQFAAATPVAAKTASSEKTEKSHEKDEKSHEKDESAAHLAAMRTHLQEARALIDGAADKVIAVSLPASKDAFRPCEKDLKNAVKHLRKAAHYAQKLSDASAS
jgi:hypothetical protein